MIQNSGSSPERKRKPKAPKGTIKIGVDRGRLRLRFSHAGRRFSFGLGLPDTPVNRAAAEQKAKQIELDILSGNFDPSLVKYKPEPLMPAQNERNRTTQAVTCGYLFDLFIQHKSKTLDPRTLEKYRTIQSLLEKHFKETRADFIGNTAAEGFVKYLSTRNSSQTIRDRLTILSAGWQWGIKQGYVELDVWSIVRAQVKVAPKQKPQPFTRQEIQAILVAFKLHPKYKHYLDFVRFLLGTGVRIAEAIGLRWKHIAKDYSSVWIGESVSRGVRKSTKTNKDRTVPLNDALKSMLQARKPPSARGDDLVFPSPKGLPINDRLFSRRAWHKILEKANVEYRRPYTCRHTFISHCLESGMNPVVVAQITGHDVQTLYENYAGVVSSRPEIPQFWEE